MPVTYSVRDPQGMTTYDSKMNPSFHEYSHIRAIEEYIAAFLYG
jgi:hypothetical protein